MYQNVKHVMIPLAAIDEAQVAWIERTAQFVVAYSTELHGECPSSQELDSYFIQTGAEIVWHQSGGKPCWSALDVDEYLALHDSEGCGDQAAITMLAFLRWMVECRHLDPKPLAPVLDRLEAEVNEWLCRLGLGMFCAEQPPSLPN